MPVGGPPPDASDAELLAAHVSGDHEAFGRLVRRHQDRLWAVAVRTLGDREDAADALQDALVNAFRRANSYKGEGAGRVTVSDPAEVETARVDVTEALATLPAEQRAALVLVDMQGYSVADAAEILQCPVGTIKSRCARGRAALLPLLAPGRTPTAGPS